LNINGYYDLLISFLDHMVMNNLLRQSNRDMVIVSREVHDLLDKMINYNAPTKAKWINLEQV
jgi:predicted Rossmann-fold nucleotide-binding protein